MSDATSSSAGSSPDADTEARNTVHAIGKAWWILFLFGLVTFVLGAIITFNPGKSVQVFAVLFGIWLLVLGVFRIIIAIVETHQVGHDRYLAILFGILAILIGLLVLHHSFETVAILGFIIGLFWVLGGVAQLIVGFTQHQPEGRVGTIIIGAIFTIVGILCLVYPGLSLSILAVIAGLGMLVYGLIEMVLSFSVRKLAKA
jgi:uncharacterized membrane protein HdeD (DUF308 family)